MYEIIVLLLLFLNGPLPVGKGGRPPSPRDRGPPGLADIPDDIYSVASISRPIYTDSAGFSYIYYDIQIAEMICVLSVKQADDTARRDNGIVECIPVRT